MSTPAPPTLWVFHAGALGDWIMTWPLLRALVRQGSHIVLVTRDSHARLARAWLLPPATPASAIIPLPGGADQRRLSHWWSGPDNRSVAPHADWRAPPPDRIINFLCDSSTASGRLWLAAAAAEFPGIPIECIGPPGSGTRAALWARERVDSLGAAPARVNRAGPIVCHIGAGSPDKRWPLDRWSDLTSAFQNAGHTVDLIAGEAEVARLSSPERAVFQTLAGRFIESLDDLALSIARARLFIGADTGPTHLAAQLGIPTLALFGPTDPAVWSPVGPAVRVLAPQSPRAMDWLDFVSVHRPTSERLAAHPAGGDIAVIENGAGDVKAGRVPDMHDAPREITRAHGLRLDR